MVPLVDAELTWFNFDVVSLSGLHQTVLILSHIVLWDLSRPTLSCVVQVSSESCVRNGFICLPISYPSLVVRMKFGPREPHTDKTIRETFERRRSLTLYLTSLRVYVYKMSLFVFCFISVRNA